MFDSRNWKFMRLLKLLDLLFGLLLIAVGVILLLDPFVLNVIAQVMMVLPVGLIPFVAIAKRKVIPKTAAMI